MATLGQLYSSGDSGLTVKKTHMVPLSSLYIEEGFNIRDIDWEHVHSIKEAWKAGETLSALFVEVTDGKEKTLVNVDQILFVSDYTTNACIRLGEEVVLPVKETYEEIKAMLEVVDG